MTSQYGNKKDCYMERGPIKRNNYYFDKENFFNLLSDLGLEFIKKSEQKSNHARVQEKN